LHFKCSVSALEPDVIWLIQPFLYCVLRIVCICDEDIVLRLACVGWISYLG